MSCNAKRLPSSHDRRMALLQKHLTFDEVRIKLGNRSRSSIYSDIDAGRLPKPLKMGGRVYWPEKDLEDHLRMLRLNDKI